MFWLSMIPGRRRLDERGAVGIIFALSLIPLILAVGFAVDYGFFVQARAQLNLAADAAAMHAVRVASEAYSSGVTTVAAGEAAGQQAGQQWFAAQLGNIGSAVISAGNPTVSVTYSSSPGGFTAAVSYVASVPTHFSRIFGVNAWTVSNAEVPSSAIITNKYVEIDMMIDNSSSMMIGASASDMTTLEMATPCSSQAPGAYQPMVSYTWIYPSGYGYGGYGSTGTKVPQQSSPPPTGSACDSRYDGDSSVCFYIPNYPTSIPISTATGLCTNGGGSNGSIPSFEGPAGTPQAPCALACHNDANNNDYYGLALKLGVTLRLNVVHQAAANVITSLKNEEQAPNQFSVGVYEFNNDLQKVYPASNAGEAGTDLATALNDVDALSPPLTANTPNTYFQSSVNTLVSELSASGDGSTPSTPIKNIFIVTDGMSDTTVAGSQTLGTFTSSTDEQICQQFKNLGLTVYVLYTPYLPIPVPTYLNTAKAYAEPAAGSAQGTLSPIEAALKACATQWSGSGTDPYFTEASDPKAINAAMQTMLSTALNSPGRISQ